MSILFKSTFTSTSDWCVTKYLDTVAWPRWHLKHILTAFPNMIVLGLFLKDNPSAVRTACGHIAFGPETGPLSRTRAWGPVTWKHHTSFCSAVSTFCPGCSPLMLVIKTCEPRRRPVCLFQAWTEAKPQTWAGSTPAVHASYAVGLHSLCINISICDFILFFIP